jgi:sugar transferase EpsL
MSARLLPPGVPILKRLFDLLLSVPGLILLSPLLAAVALIVWRAEGRPIFFRQARPGLNSELFPMYKFRTMRNLIDSSGRELPDAARLSPLGRFLRATSLDELPELLNVVRGEMSLVGPRPCLQNTCPAIHPNKLGVTTCCPG